MAASTSSKGKNIVFITGETKDRIGTKEDVALITDTFEKYYNAEVLDWIDKKDYKKLFGDLKTNKSWLKKFEECNFVIIFCLFHGSSDGRIKNSDKLNSLKMHFLNPFFKIPQLDGKLKWLVSQACRGSYKVIECDGFAQEIFSNYYMISYSTSEGAPTFQYEKTGKIFIKYLCEELENNAKNNYAKSLIKILESVNARIEKYGKDNSFRYYPHSQIYHNFGDNFQFHF